MVQRNEEGGFPSTLPSTVEGGSVRMRGRPQKLRWKLPGVNLPQTPRLYVRRNYWDASISMSTKNAIVNNVNRNNAQ